MFEKGLEGGKCNPSQLDLIHSFKRAELETIQARNLKRLESFNAQNIQIKIKGTLKQNPTKEEIEQVKEVLAKGSIHPKSLQLEEGVVSYVYQALHASVHTTQNKQDIKVFDVYPRDTPTWRRG